MKKLQRFYKGTILFFIFFALLSPILLHAQNSIDDRFGKISISEFKKIKCDLDSFASAAYIYDSGKSSFREVEGAGFVLDFERTARLQIYNQEGLEHATIVVPLYKKDNSNLELFKDFKAFTYNLENSGLVKTELIEEDVFEEEYNENWIFKKFTFPKAKAGSILEFYYRVESPFLFNLYDWEFQHDIPVFASEYIVDIIPFYNYMINPKGTLEINAEEPKVVGPTLRFNGYEYKETRYKWSLKDVPAFYEEDYMTSRKDYIAKVEFQLSKVNYPGSGSTNYMTSWKDLIKRLIAETKFGKHMKKKADDDVVSQLVNGDMDDLTKAKSIQKYITENYRWDGSRFIYPKKSIKDFEKVKEGNCTEINLKMLTLLEEAGLKAFPVLLSTRDHGKVDYGYPFIEGFNYCVIVLEIDDNFVFIDGTRKYLPVGLLPFECRNGSGLMVKKKESVTIDLNADNSLYRVVNHASMFVDASSNEVNLMVKITAYDYAAAEYRSLYHKNPDGFIGAISGVDNATDVKVRFKDELAKPFVISYKTQLSENWSDMNYVSPVLSGKITENPFKLPVRTYPVDFNVRKLYEYRFSFALPAGYEMIEFPESEKIKLADGQLYYDYKSIYTPTTRLFQLSNKFLIANPVIEAKYYQDLKKVYDEVIKKLDQPIVVKRT